MLIDEIDVTFSAGHGGPGKVSFGRMLRSGPDGGNGGKGGDIYITVTSDLRALNQFSSNPYVSAPDGEPGGGNRTFGKKAPDITIELPLGTTLYDQDSGEQIELNDLSQKLLICHGGLGGRGNFEFKSAKNTAPEYAQPGLPGQQRNFKLVLKFLAEFGLIGLPNAGKSSLLNSLTRSKAEVGSYPFTTLEANLGVFHAKVIADIPGIITGAAEGKGLGLKFLKHVEKVRVLLHCIASDSPDVIADYHTINSEMEKFNPRLLQKTRIILLTKSDLVSPEQIASGKKLLTPLGYKILPVSIHDWDSLQMLESHLLSL